MDDHSPLEIGPEHPDFQRTYMAEQRSRYAKLAANPANPIVSRLVGLGLVLLGAGSVWFDWYTLKTDSYFYNLPVVLGPALAILGLPMLFVARDFRLARADGTFKGGVKAMGITGSFLWLCTVGLLAYRFETYEPSDSDYLTRVAASMGNGLPRMESPEVRLDSVTAGPGKKLTVTYSLMDREGGVPVDQSVRTELFSSYRESDCKEPTIVHLLERGVPIDYRYLGKNHLSIIEVQLTEAACK